MADFPAVLLPTVLLPTVLPTPSPILAESVAVDTEVVVAILLVLALIGLAIVVLAVLGIACGVRYGRRPDDRRAAVVWRICLVAQTLGALGVIALFGPGRTVAPIAVAVLAPLVSLTAFALARASVATPR